MSKRIISVEETFAAHSRLTRQQLAQRMPPTQVVIVRPRKRQGKAVDAHAQTDRDGDGPSAADLIRASARLPQRELPRNSLVLHCGFGRIEEWKWLIRQF